MYQGQPYQNQPGAQQPQTPSGPVPQTPSGSYPQNPQGPQMQPGPYPQGPGQQMPQNPQGPQMQPGPYPQGPGQQMPQNPQEQHWQQGQTPQSQQGPAGYMQQPGQGQQMPVGAPQQTGPTIHHFVTTAFDLPGFRVVRNLGIVRGIIVRSRSVVGNIGASFQQIFGGNISIYTELCEQTRRDAYELMIQHAVQSGANAIIGVRYDGTELSPGVTEVLCYGTAVTIAPAEQQK